MEVFGSDIVLRERPGSHVFTDGIACDVMCIIVYNSVYKFTTDQLTGTTNRWPATIKSGGGCCREQIAGEICVGKL